MWFADPVRVAMATHSGTWIDWCTKLDQERDLPGGNRAVPSEHEVNRLQIQAELDASVAIDHARSLKALVGEIRDPDSAFGFLARNLPLAAVSADADGVFTGAYGSALSRIGMAEGEMVGTSLRSWGEKVRTIIDRVNDGRSTLFDIEGVANGNEFRFRCLSVPDGTGGSVCLLTDATDVLEAESSASKDREILHMAMEAAGGGIVVQDETGTLLSHNDAAVEIVGRSLADLFRANGDPGVFDPVHQDGRPFLPDDFPGRAAIRTGLPQRNVMMGIRHPSGERRWLSISSFPIKLQGSDAVMTSFADVSEREASRLSLRDSEERFRLLAERAPLGILINDNEGHVLYVNPQAEELAGRASAEIRDLGWESLVHVDDRSLLASAERHPDGLAVEYRVLRPDGSTRWVRSRSAQIYDHDGEPIGTVATAADITDLQMTNERLKESEERMRAIVETAAEGIITVDERGTIVEFNAAAERLFKYDSEEMIGKQNVFKVLAVEDRERMRGHFRSFLEGAPPRFIGGTGTEIMGLTRDGLPVPIELRITELHTSEGRLFTGLIRDLSEHKAFERELEHLATHDPLTGLPNRALLTAQLETALARANRHDSSVGVLFVDIDRVKLVTEALGHRAGDDLILQTAARLRETTGSGSTLARFSNDQFVVFLEDLDDVGDAVEVATRIIEQINEPFTVVGEEAFVDASIGIAFAPDGMGTAETLVSNADVAMGRAKMSSVTRYEVFDTEMRAWVETRRKTEIALRHGIERDEFVLHYQPVVELDGTHICGFEALVRWNHPYLGLLPPNEFIPVAEDSGLIVPMGHWIMSEAIRQSALWSAAFGKGGRSLSVAINLSARQLAQPDLADLVARELDRADADPALVAFEITETVLLEDVTSAERTLTDLKDLGVKLSLDDFGTGYSSLTYLCRLPIDTVKVDRSFVSQLGTGSRDASIVEMVVGMAHMLQLDVVAEGVETAEQAEVLRDWGCRYAQGFLFSKPKPIGEAERLLDIFELVDGPGPAD